MTDRIKKEPRERINNTQLLADNPTLRVRHFHQVGNSRSMTVAYREGHSTIEIATAVVNPVDCFCRKMGTKLAIEHFLAGKVVIIPKVGNAPASYTLLRNFAL